MDPQTPRYHPGVTFSYPLTGFSRDCPFPKDRLTGLGITSWQRRKNLRLVNCLYPSMALPSPPPQRATSGQEHKKPGGSPTLSCNYFLSHQTETGGSHGDQWLPVLAPLLSGGLGSLKAHGDELRTPLPVPGSSGNPVLLHVFVPLILRARFSGGWRGQALCGPLASSLG